MGLPCAKTRSKNQTSELIGEFPMVGTEKETQSLKTWVEPEVRSLDVAETAAAPKLGFDGGIAFPDCKRS
jgi:hypothetical protein